MAASVSAGSALNDNGLAALPARPPTPPREAQQKAASARPSIHRTVSEVQQQTPPSAILVSPATTQTTEGRRRKRVEWSGRTEYKEPEKLIDGFLSAKSSPLLGSSSRKRPIKGILKISSSPAQPSTSQLSARLDAAGDAINIPEMLDSSIKQLAGADRDSKVDAYMTLARSLKASNNLPDRVALQGKMSILTQFIQRDITAKPIDRSLANHALNLLLTFLHFNAIASTIPHDFAIFIVDHAIRTFEDPSTTKETVRYLMQVIAFQSFSSKVMSNERVGRLLAAVHKIEDNITGKSIVMSRIKLYKRLVKQCPNSMAGHKTWLQDMFTDTLSLTKDIRDEAISLGMEAGFSLRHEKQLQRNVMEVLETTLEDQSFIEHYIESLAAILEKKDSARSSSVPQIWTVVNLFLKCPPDKWELYTQWLRVVQAAFNSSYPETKLQANIAWGRFVFLSLSDSKLNSNALKMICQPILSQLRNKATKNVEEAAKVRRAIIGIACTLFYYALRPNTDKYSPDMIWDVAVQPLVARILTLEDSAGIPGDWTNEAAKILNGLVDNTTQRHWRDERIRNPAIIRADELPPIDVKWIRRNSARVFEAVTPFFQRKIADLAQPSSVANKLWTSLLGAVAAASAKDIKVSDDTLDFLAGAFTCLFHIWTSDKPWSLADSSQACLDGVHTMLQMLVDSIGAGAFTQQRLAISPDNTFQRAPSSSRVDSKTRGVIRTPMLHLVNLFCRLPAGVSDDDQYATFIVSALEPFFDGKSEKIRVDQTREMFTSLPGATFCPLGIWRLACANLTLPFKRTLTSVSQSEKILGPEYREMVSFLDRTMASLPNVPFTDVAELFDLLDRHIVHHFGQAGRVQLLIEPLAKTVAKGFSGEEPAATNRRILVAAKLLNAAQFPKDKQAMESARHHLWGAIAAPNQQTVFRPFDFLFKATTSTLEVGYDILLKENDTKVICELLAGTAAFCDRCPGPQVETTLEALSTGIRPWALDASESLKAADQSTVSEVGSIEHSRVESLKPIQSQMKHLWTSVCALITANVHPQTLKTEVVENLLSDGLKSANPDIAKITRDAYNEILLAGGPVTQSMRSLVSSISSKLDAEPQPTEDSSSAFGAQPSTGPGSKFKTAMAFVSPRPSIPMSTINTPSPLGPGSRRSPRQSTMKQLTPTPVKSRSAKKTTPRLRHDNSQIEFTAIPSSSPQLGESQYLTERQKEVRARQETESVLYEERKEDSPELEITPAPQPVSETEEKQKTPERDYGELVSNTPTPRRGQLLALDFNDPPSSPPEPRPYPLQAEIESRSRHSESMEWEFSSPVSSPIKAKTRDALAFSPENAEDEDLTESLTVHVPDQLDPPSGDRQRSSSDIHAVPPPPLSTLEPSDQSLEQSVDVPTPPSRRSRRQRKVSQAKQEAEMCEELRASQSKPTRTSKRRSQSESQNVAVDSQGDSFAFSEGDESKLMNLVQEVESRQANARKGVAISPVEPQAVSKNLAATTGAEAEAAPESVEAEDEQEEVASDKVEEVPVESNKKEEDQPGRPPASALSKRKTRSQPISRSQSPERSTRSGSKKTSKGKRKVVENFDWRTDFGRHKRRKSSHRKGEDSLSTSGADESEPPQNLPSQARSQSRDKARRSKRGSSDPELLVLPSPRRSTRGRKRESRVKEEPVESDAEQHTQEQEQEVEEKSQLPILSVAEYERSEDTDEELLSQLIADSVSASQSQSQPPEEDSIVAFTDVADETIAQPAVESADGPMQEAPEEPADPAVAVLQNLRTGLGLLQKSKMTPEQVSEMETLILDLKREMYQAEYRGRKGASQK